MKRSLRRWNAKRKSRWESLCKQCGICCYEKRRTPNGEYKIDFTAPCRHLDTEANRCRIYPERFRLCSACRKMTIFHAWFADYLPDTCGYVERFRRWQKPSRS